MDNYIEIPSFVTLQVKLYELDFQLEAKLVPINKDQGLAIKMVLSQNREALYSCTNLGDLYDYLRDQMGIRWMVTNNFAELYRGESLQ